jgi:hypothetical protein
MIDFFPLNNKDEDSINAALYHADTILQVYNLLNKYFDNQEPREEFFREPEEMERMNVDENQ